MANLLNVVADHSDSASASLSVIEFGNLPWQPKRIYWLSDFVDESTRGNHAHRKLSQIFVAVSGAVDLEIFHGVERKVYHLSQDSLALQLRPGTWRVISNATSDAILMVLADAPYDESDYIRNWDEYLAWFNSEHINE